MKTVSVSSVKGGTGKTLVAANLLLKLSKHGKVGGIDADFDASNLGMMLGITDRIQRRDDKFIPIQYSKNVQVFTMSSFIEPTKGVSKTGLEYAQIIEDMVENTIWDCEFFVVDLPAGSSDIFKEVNYIFADSLIGTVVVTQPNSLKQAKQLCNLCIRNGIPILGVIENMSGYHCPSCSEVSEPFGIDSTAALRDEYMCDILGKIPLSIDIRDKVFNSDPLLVDSLGEPIDKAVEKILATKPEHIGIRDRIKRAIKDVAQKTVFELMKFVVKSANTDLDIKSLQAKHNMYGNRVIRVMLTDMIKRKLYFDNRMVIRDGRMEVVDKGSAIDFVLEIDVHCLPWIVNMRKKVGDGYIPYSIEDAWLNSEIKTYGAGSTVNVQLFFDDIWSGVRPKLQEKFGRLLEAIF